MTEGAESLAPWRRVLVIDDGSILIGALGAALGRRGYDVHSVKLDDGPRTLPAALIRYSPDVVLLNQTTLTRSHCRLGRWLRRDAPKFLALRQGDQPTAPAELIGSLPGPVTICTPADLQALLP